MSKKNMSKNYEEIAGKYELGLYELEDFAKRILSVFSDGVIILQGDLASGKTTFVKTAAGILGKGELVSSPTFALMQDYGSFFHYDFYRVELKEIIQNGLFDNFFEDGLHAVEWGDERLEELLKKYNIPLCKIKISPSKKGREYEVSFA